MIAYSVFQAIAGIITAISGFLLWPMKWYALLPALLGIWVGSFVAVCVVYLLVLFVISLFVDKSKTPEHRSGFYRFCLTQTYELILKIGRVKIRAGGTEKLEGLPPFLLVANHVCALDPFIGMCVCKPRELSYVSKPENFDIPIVGAFMRKCFFLPIDRKSERNARDCILQAAKQIRDGIACMGIFPEGTRAKDGVLLPFRNGAFQIGKRAGAPIVIARTKGMENIKHNYFLRRTDVTFEILDVIPAEEAAHMTTAAIGERMRCDLTTM